MAQHRPPPVGRNETVSGAASPETLTNQNKVLSLSKILADRTILYTGGSVLVKYLLCTYFASHFASHPFIRFASLKRFSDGAIKC
jgi:hypothetical protein